jgi:hypothetical protein
LSQAEWGNAFSDGMLMSSATPEPVDAIISFESGDAASIAQSADGVHFVSENIGRLLEGWIPGALGGSGPVDFWTPPTSTGSSDHPSFYGISYDSSTDGWLDAVLVLNTPVDHPSGSPQFNIVFHTTDGGSVWKPVYEWTSRM